MNEIIILQEEQRLKLKLIIELLSSHIVYNFDDN